MSDLSPVMQETLDALRAVASSTPHFVGVSAWGIANLLYGPIPAKYRRDLRTYEPTIRKRLYKLQALGLVEKYRSEVDGRSFWRPSGSAR